MPDLNHCLSTVWLVVLSVAAGTTATRTAAAAEGTGWRGDGTGRYAEAQPPLTWDLVAGANILWKTKVGKGQSTPVVADPGKGDKQRASMPRSQSILPGRIFVTAEPDKLLALDRETGKLLWSTDNGYQSLPPGSTVSAKRPTTAPGCGYATPTPVTDGSFVYACFGTGIVVGYDLAGSRRWIRHLDLPLLTEYGRSVSPVLAEGRLLVSLGGLVALDPQTGEILWQTLQAKPTYGTPVVARIGDVAVAITPNGDCVRVSDGKLLASGLARGTYASPVVYAGRVYFVGPPAVAVRLPDQPGEKLVCEQLWENDDLDGEFFASPICHEGLVYCAANEGTLYVLEAGTGKLVFQQELEIRSASGKPGREPANLYPSLTLAGARLLLGNDAGETLVLAPGSQYRELGRSYLDRGSGASPVPDGKMLFLRGGETLYGVGVVGQESR
ncbi:MAG: PQQ-binding-like beta-propeller repeat protein [Planctomycetota bacterium]|nr:PQQ-binding-like beta-propeller repeat protein [Planctomycetota bacterium]